MQVPLHRSVAISTAMCTPSCPSRQHLQSHKPRKAPQETQVALPTLIAINGTYCNHHTPLWRPRRLHRHALPYPQVLMPTTSTATSLCSVNRILLPRRLRKGTSNLCKKRMLHGLAGRDAVLMVESQHAIKQVKRVRIAPFGRL